MAKHLSRLGVVAVSLALMSAGMACAEGLSDPTRPPDALTALASAPGAATTQTGPVLQSVQISPTSRSAIISGQHVVQGGKYGDARVVRISESEVMLKSGSETQTLKLFPDVEKRVSQTAVRKNTQRKAK